MHLSSKKVIIFSFLIGCGLSMAFLSFALSPVQAANVNVNASVEGYCGDGFVSSALGEECDGTSAGACYNGSCNVASCTCPSPGCNGEAGEECASNAECSTGRFCNTSCVCQVIGSLPCVVSSWTTTETACINGQKTVTNTSNCGDIVTTVVSCSVPACGNGVIEPAQAEQCDDGNASGGDCCSGTCQIEHLLTNVFDSDVTNTSAIVNWSSPCSRPVTISIEWGTTPAVSDGSVGGLTGSSFSLSGLNPATVYFYRVTSNDGFTTVSVNGSFQTLGGAEICNNNIDDDSDGLCDYPGSTCTDGSTPGDSECSCTPNFVCTPTAACDANNNQPVTCIDQTIPKCQPDYDATQSCECPGVIPGACQQVDPDTCTLIDIPNCCGNGTCEPPGEDPFSCLVDCPASCLSDWQCNAWTPEPCPPSGIQTRDCFDLNACDIPINPPPNTQTCGGICPGLSCGVGQQINVLECICENIVPFCGNAICESGETHDSCPVDCIPPCTPNWTCDAWGECLNDLQTRGCTDLNACGLDLDKPPVIRSCALGCEVACGTCQTIDLNSCSCLPIPLCCGNRACETNESLWSCPVDCGIPPTLRLTLTVCLDGKDNDGDGLVDYPTDPGCSKPTDNSELNLAEVIENLREFLQDTIFDNPQVEQINGVLTPALIATIAVNTFATFSFFNFFSYLQFFFTQPFAALFRRKRKKWGVVYNSLTKVPVDLAIVRLYKKPEGKLVQSRVTDKQGRYNFLVDPGDYYLTVTKPRFDFPTSYLMDKKEDISYLDLYHGENITVTNRRVTITANIPIDPQVEEKPVGKVIFQHYLRKIQYAAAFSAVPLAVISALINPGVLTLSMLGFHCLLYVLFRRLGYQRPPKNWGIIYDTSNKKPIGRAITRIYDKQYNKLLETRITDGKGRYSFLVNNNIYYVTAEKLGYNQFKSADIDLINKKVEAIVGSDIGLNKLKAGEAAVIVSSESEVKPAPTSTLTPPPGKVGLPSSISPKPIAAASSTEEPTLRDIDDHLSKLSVGRESVEELTKAKEEVEDIKEDIEQQKEELEKLEDKAKEIEESVTEKLENLGREEKLTSTNTDQALIESSGKTIAEQLQEIKAKRDQGSGGAATTTSPSSELSEPPVSQTPSPNQPPSSPPLVQSPQTSDNQGSTPLTNDKPTSDKNIFG